MCRCGGLVASMAYGWLIFKTFAFGEGSKRVFQGTFCAPLLASDGALVTKGAAHNTRRPPCCSFALARQSAHLYWSHRV